MEQKKLYVKPEELVIEMKMHNAILAESAEEIPARPMDFTDTDLDH